MTGYDRLVQAICDLLTRQERVIVAIDGRCGSGKTTLAARLKRVPHGRFLSPPGAAHPGASGLPR